MSSTYEILCKRLSALAEDAGANNALVVDDSGHPYGFGTALDSQELVHFGPLLDEILASAERPLNRGGHVHFVRSAEAPFVVAESFAGIYVLVLMFDAEPDVSVARTYLKRALPEIEALVVSLPPEGPGMGRAVTARRR